jgi:MSHA biogenesis protein MshE
MDDRRPLGCDGGRSGVYELLEIDAGIADAIRRVDLTEVGRLAALSPGFVPLVQCALQYALQGITSVDEVMSSMSGLEEPERRVSLLDDVLSSEANAADAPTDARLSG